MKKLLILSVLVALGSATAAFGQGGVTSGGFGHSSTGGAFGSSPATPGTNSLGTALSSGRGGSARKKGPPLGTGNLVVDREDKRAARTVHSICRGC